MEFSDHTLESACAGRSFDIEVYGSGRPVIVFPEGDSSCTSWDNGGMVDALSQLLDGDVQLFCVDSADDEGWYPSWSSADYRLGNISAYLSFVEEELVPFVAAHANSPELPLVAGAGMGALNATLALLRRPDLFSGLLAMSGTYDARAFAGDAFDGVWAQLSPVDLVADLPDGWLEGRPMAFVCGQGRGEDGIGTQRALDGAFAERGIVATFEYWGFDVSHDWTWWCEEAKQLLPCLLVDGGLADRRLTTKAAIAKAAADHAAATLVRERDALADAQASLKAARAGIKAADRRLGAEEAVVAERQASVDELSQVAAAAWAERDNYAALLADAEEKARAAQSVVNTAAHGLASAQWIAGEARAAVEQALADKEAAEARVAGCKAAVRAATTADRKASEAYDAVMAEIKGMA